MARILASRLAKLEASNKPKASVVQNRVLRVDPYGNVLGPLPKFPALVVVDHGSDAEWEARLQKQQADLITTAAASEIKHQAAIEAAKKEQQSC